MEWWYDILLFDSWLDKGDFCGFLSVHITTSTYYVMAYVTHFETRADVWSLHNQLFTGNLSKGKILEHTYIFTLLATCIEATVII